MRVRGPQPNVSHWVRIVKEQVEREREELAAAEQEESVEATKRPRG
jgi:hypothetical protein